MNDNKNNTNKSDNNDNQHHQEGGIINEYIVEEKDTLDDIANRYGVTIEEILAANPDLHEPADMVKPGLKLMIPFKEHKQ